MDTEEEQWIKREKLRFEREQRRQSLISLTWGLVITLALFAVLFIDFEASGHMAFAAVGGDVGKTMDMNTMSDASDQSLSRLPQYALGFIEPIGLSDPPVHDSKGCKADMRWPVLPHVLVRRFKAPAQVWTPGHRGVDIVAVEGTPLLAPADGVISFAGVVAGKSVVSIRHKSLTLTLEPAQTLLPIGTPGSQRLADRYRHRHLGSLHWCLCALGCAEKQEGI